MAEVPVLSPLHNPSRPESWFRRVAGNLEGRVFSVDPLPEGSRLVIAPAALGATPTNRATANTKSTTP